MEILFRMDWGILMKQIGNNEYIFKGWEWVEVAEYFSNRSDLCDASAIVIINKNINLICDDLEHDADFIGHPDVLKIREFVRKVSLNEDGFASPLWKGLYKIQSDLVFLSYFSILYRNLWT